MRRIIKMIKKKRRRRMAKSKEDRRQEFDKVLGKAKVNFKKFSEELSVLAKKSERGILKASKTGKIQLDIMSLNVQREKLYYDIGKKIAAINSKKTIDIPELEPLWKRMSKIEDDAEKKKEQLVLVKKEKRAQN